MKWIYLLLFSPSICNGQNNAFFETTFWFKDASGNQDSIVVGHDIEANSFYNPQFGESDIANYWDSVFEVRAAHYSAWYFMDDTLVLSKKIVAANEQGFDPDYNCLWFNEGIIFFVRVVNLPITIYWDRSAFENSFCRNRSTLTPNLFPTILPDWYVDFEEDVDWVCLAERDSFIVSSFNDAFSFYHTDTLEGGIVDTLAAILFDSEYQGQFDSPCTSTVSTNIANSYEEVIIYPNPSTDFVNISYGEDVNWQLIDLMGQKLKQGRGNKIDISDCGNGLHFIDIFDQRGFLIYSGKVLKM